MIKKANLIKLVILGLTTISISLLLIYHYYPNIFTTKIITAFNKQNSKNPVETKTEEENKIEETSQNENQESQNKDTIKETELTSTNNNNQSSSSKQPSTSKTKNWWDYPDKIYPVTKSGDDLLVLVNKQYKLPSTYAPSDLVPASQSGIRTIGNIYVRSILIEPLKKLNESAKQDGIDLSIISGYRSYQTQEATYNYWVQYNGGNTDIADQISARAGHSQHQLGTAVDFSSSEIGDRIGAEFDNTRASKWLEANAWKYGFALAYPKGYEKTTGYQYESWHYRFIGVDNAIIWHKSNLILELWLKEK